MAIFTQSFRLKAANTSSNKTSIMDKISNTSNEYYTRVNTTDTEITEIGQFVCYLDPTRFTDQQSSTSIKSISIEFESKKTDISLVSNSNTRFVFWGAEGGGMISYPTSTTFSLSSLDYWTSSYNTTKDGPYWQTGGVPTSEYQTYKIKLFENTTLPRSVSQLNNWGIVIGIGYTDNSTVKANLYLRNLWVKVEYEATEYTANVVAYPSSTAGTVSRILHTKGGSTTYGWLTNGYYYNVERNSILTLRASPSTNYYIDSWDKNGKILSYGNTDCEVTIDTNNATYYANFVKYQYTVNTSASNGSLIGGGTFDVGSSITLIATPNYGWKCQYIYKVDASGNNLGIVATNDGNYDSRLTYSFTLGSENVYYKASFIENTYTITYHSNGGSYFETVTDTYTVGGTVLLKPGTGSLGRLPETENGYTITIKGNGSSYDDKPLTAINTRTYVIGNWNTKADGTGTSYAYDSEYSSGISLELYMIWDSYIASSNYGKIKFPTTDEYQRDGYTLLGFSTNQNATSATYSPGDSIQPSANTTYYAIWKKTISITYDINGGSGELPTPPASKDIYNTTASTDFSLTTTNLSISKEGHTFGGWSKTKGGTIAVGSSITVSDNTTLYAIWKVNQYTITPKIYLIDLNGNITENNSGGYLQLEDGTTLSSSQAFNYGEIIHVTAKVNSGYAFSKWGDIPSALNSRDITIPAQNIEISAYFIIKNKVLVINKNSSSSNSDVSIWLREKIDSSTYGSWFQMPYDNEYSFSKNTTVQIIFEHGENYEFDHIVASQVGLPPVGLDPYSDYQITGQTTFTVYSNKRESYNNIYLGSSNKPYTSGYVKNPNFSFEEEISSIWVGGKQIMGKAPKELYPYIIDTLLGDTLYIGLYDSIDNWKNGANMKTKIPDSAYKNNPNQIKHLKMSNNIIKIGSSAFRGVGLETIQLSSNLLELGALAFYQGNTGVASYFNNYKKIYLPASLVLLNKSSGFDFETSSIEKIAVDKNNLYYTSDSQGVLYNKNKTLLIQYPQRRKNNTYYLPFIEGIFGDYCFVNQNYLKDIYYKGTKQQWDSLITLEGSHTGTFTIHCSDGTTFRAQL